MDLIFEEMFMKNYVFKDVMIQKIWSDISYEKKTKLPLLFLSFTIFFSYNCKVSTDCKWRHTSY